jgi:xylulose-5-phosphate/fructose-6-phosphate phosphoketolase
VAVSLRCCVVAAAMSPTLETLAAVDLLLRHALELKVRVVNVVNLMTLEPVASVRTVSLIERLRRWLIHTLTYRRAGHEDLDVRGYKEEGTTATSFDICLLNDLDRFNLVPPQ